MFYVIVGRPRVPQRRRRQEFILSHGAEGAQCPYLLRAGVFGLVGLESQLPSDLRTHFSVDLVQPEAAGQGAACLSA